MQMNIFDITAFKSSKIITTHYSTSFSLGIRTMAKKYHYPIYAVYGFVRYADEIVDTFHEYDKKTLFESFRMETYKAIAQKISLNPVLQSFQLVVNKYNITSELIDAFLDSMAMDLNNQNYSEASYKKYIYGSAEVVGLMCLKVFCEGDEAQYEILKEPARKLGSAFQKVNFLRDMKSDYFDRGRMYFPGVDFDEFDIEEKLKIEQDIQYDFEEALKGILQLPAGAKLGVYLAYVYYKKLFDKIKSTPPVIIRKSRIRIPDNTKFFLLIQSWLKCRMNFM